VPIDVIGSSSGGSLLASYFCRDGLPGLHSYIHDGPLASDSGIAAIVNSQVIEEVLDWVFRGTRVEHLGVRFVPVTMALPSGGAPEARAVTSGTLGEAVRVSGAFPFFIAPTTKKGMVYADGSLATLIPARALPSFGADLVFAFSSVPGPNDSNPLAVVPGMGLLFKYTPLGRLVDLVASNGYFLEQVTQAVGCDATVYIQSSESNISLLEILLFGHAQRIITESERDPRVRAGAAACAAAWNEFAQRQDRALQPGSHGPH
jgi:predicted acylesterase/phospholipase RssA